MRAVIQRVRNGDSGSDVQWMAEKLATIRIFADEQGKMNRSITESRGEALLVSQFTLLGETARGRRPGFDRAAPPEVARTLYEAVVTELRQRVVPVETGVFGAHMVVSLENDGPVTFVLDSAEGPIRRPG